MRARIHHGIGGCGGSCVELEQDGYRLVLDVGRPPTAERDQEAALPDVPGLASGDDPRLLGVILSHGHQDHWALMSHVHPDVPRYVGKASADILRAAKFWGTGIGIDLAETGHLAHRAPFVLGPFTITPYLNDHCAFDAYSLLVEAGGSRLFYAGDFRGHGRKGALFDELLLDPPAGVDVLVCEGTGVHREDVGEPVTEVAEAQVEMDLAATFGGTDGLVVVLSSPQNIDRLVTTYRAALRAERDLVIDLYGADVAAASGQATVPQLGDDWPCVHVYLPHDQRVQVLGSKEFHRVADVLTKRLFAEALAAEPSKYVLFGAFQPELRRLVAALGPKIGAVVWSMADGYLTEASGIALRADLAAAGVPLVHHHSSGRARPEQLQELVAAMQPGGVVPVHTDFPEALAALAGPSGSEPGGHGWWTVGATDDDHSADDQDVERVNDEG